MRRIVLFWGCLWLFVSGVAGERSFRLPFAAGELQVLFLAENAARLRYVEVASPDTLPEWIYAPLPSEQKFKVKRKRRGESTALETGEMKIVVHRSSRSVEVLDSRGTTVFTADDLTWEQTSEHIGVARLAWRNTPDEHLYGLGQFQDGFADVKGLTRRLTQVNTQIAIPFLLSNKGYAVLWNNYGLTDFNPGENTVALVKNGGRGEVLEVDITTTEGGAKERRESNFFTGVIEVPESGRYALLLDVGQKMARRHHLQIDGKQIIDMHNLWLPPTASAIVELKEGRHTVQAELEREDRPTVSWRKIDDTSVLRSPLATAVDFTVFVGTSDEVIASYRSVTGGSPMMPLWALGYIHCRERFHSQSELLDVAGEFRRREIPLDLIVQDWQYWGRHGWNAMRFDEKAYPAPKAMTDSLHAMDMKLMLSVWSKIDPSSEVGKKAQEKSYFIPGTQWIDFFNPEAASFYWRNFSGRLLLPYGIDAWWQDATEPENDDLLGRTVMGGKYAGELFRNVYPLLVNKTVYEGCRRDDPTRRTMILTRSGFPGIQRYGAALWSGDVGHDWETLRRQIVAGHGLMATGLPWWTYDAGGFFRPGNQYSDAAYRECMLRWIQIGAYLPLMRVHGYMSDTEPWRYGEATERRIRQAIRGRYALISYIYSMARKVASQGYTIMRPLVFDYPADTDALERKYDFMFGDHFLVVPVTEPGIREMEVYLPSVPGGWYAYEEGTHYAGGGKTVVPVTLEHIPVFVKAGSILPVNIGGGVSTAAVSADTLLEVRLFAGADGRFTLYEDEGDNYNYETGHYTTIEMKWEDKRKRLTIGRRSGAFEGMAERRTFVVKLSDGQSRTVNYDGRSISVLF